MTDKKGRVILGICDSQDSGASLFIDGKLVDAISEERLNREKQTRMFPYLSIKHLLDAHNLSLKDVDRVVLASSMTPSFILRLFNRDYNKSFVNEREPFQFSYLYHAYIIYQSLARKSYIIREIDAFFSKLIIKSRLCLWKHRLHIIDHHTAHAASAYYTSGLKDALVITMDGMGDGLSVTVSIGHNKSLKRIFTQSGFCAIGNYYSRFTEYLGFKPLRHEGKITGLAAYGNPDATISHMKKVLRFKRRGFNYLNYFFPHSKKKGVFKQIECYSKEDIAAGLQKNLEEEVCKFIEYWIEKTGTRNIALAGGIFANVKLNQRIHEIEGINSVYIFPHMGDGGISAGAVLNYLKPEPFTLRNILLGPRYSDKEIRKELVKTNLKFKYHKNIEKKIARLIAKGKVIARFDGRMEYGPRALGNRSILYQVTDVNVNDFLNKKLKRTEFMPFAPATLIEYVDKCYKGIKGAEYPARFMTITFDCTDWMKKKCGGVVHVDGTARPQILSKKDNPSFYKIIDEYRKLTGIPCIINTSFNMHEEPIVCSPYDAIRAFKDSRLDFLALENFLARL